MHDAHTVLLGNGLFDRDRAPGIATDPVDFDPHASGRVRYHFQGHGEALSGRGRAGR
ncbi:Uncharacterised protein [Mycobacterium tuberculosis]|nr:Uncharacterised protein [Mycobacterium tuberculosis]